VRERFFSIASDEHQRVTLDSFLALFSRVFAHSIEARLKLVFEILDFDADGAVCAHDIKIVLNYIPYLSDCSQDVEMEEEPAQEGLYHSGMGRDIDPSHKTLTFEKINELTACLLKGKQQVDLQEFCTFNNHVSSDILWAVMAVLESCLPCALFYSREVDEFRAELINNELKQSPCYAKALDFNNLDYDYCSSDSDFDQADADMSEVQAIASPCFMPNFKLTSPVKRMSRDLSSPGLRRSESSSSRHLLSISRSSHLISKQKQVKLQKARKKWT